VPACARAHPLATTAVDGGTVGWRGQTRLPGPPPGAVVELGGGCCAGDWADPRGTNGSGSPLTRLPTEALVLAMHHGSTYYHVLFDALPRLLPYVPYLRAHPATVVVVTDEGGVLVPLLALLGFGGGRVAALRRGAALTAPRLLFPPPPAALPPCYRPAAAAAVAAYVPPPPPPPPPPAGPTAPPPLPVFALLRRSTRGGGGGGRPCTHARCVRNFTALAGALAARLAGRYRLVVVPPGGPFPARVALFRGAAVLAGVHGAGLANGIYLPRGAVLMQLWGGRHDLYAAVAAAAGARWVPIVDGGLGTAVGAAALRVNVSLVVDAIDAALGGG